MEKMAGRLIHGKNGRTPFGIGAPLCVSSPTRNAGILQETFQFRSIRKTCILNYGCAWFKANFKIPKIMRWPRK